MINKDNEYQTLIVPDTKFSSTYWRDILRYRDLLYFLVYKEIAVLYKQTILGFSWAIIRPLFSMVIFSIIFGNLAKIPSDGIPYPIFSYVALVPWTYFSTALTKSSLSLISFSAIFTKVYFPRVFIPIVPVISGLLDFAIAFSFVLIMMFYYDIMPSYSILILPYLILMMVVFSTAIGLFLSALSIQYRDIRNGMQFLTQLLMYATPVVWPVSLLSEKISANMFKIYSFFPMVGVIEGFRAAILGKTPIPWDLILSGSITCLILIVLSLIYFSRKEKIFADVA
jgi:lipopolysaccharide transport system permease protein